MAYDLDFANRVRELIGAEPDLAEQPMFGGLAFLLAGNIAVAVRGRGGLMVRVGPEGEAAALKRRHAGPMHMRNRPMRGWIVVEPEGLRSRRELSSWVTRGVDFAHTLPRKR